MQGLPREVLAICFIILLADIAFGIIVPTFSIFAQDVGVSLALLGAINAAGGLAQLFLAVPIGILSDRIGRRAIVVTGVLCFASSLACFALANGPELILIGRLLQGLAGVATFQIGAAYLGDITAPGQRAVAFGAFTTAMGVGFAIGPALGGWLSAQWEPRVSYAVGAVIAAATATLAQLLMRPREVVPDGAAAPDRRWWIHIGGLARRPDLLTIASGNVVMSFAFSGAITVFFPLLAEDAGLSAASIGVLFAVRALVSAAGRLPNSLVTRRIGDRPVLLGALVVEMLVSLCLTVVSSPLWFGVLLAFEGLAFGAYLVAGQTWVADRTTPRERGAAVGLYGAAGSIGGVAAPLALGIIAERQGLHSVYLVTSGVTLVGLLAFLCGLRVLGAAERQTPHPSA